MRHSIWVPLSSSPQGSLCNSWEEIPPTQTKVTNTCQTLFRTINTPLTRWQWHGSKTLRITSLLTLAPAHDDNMIDDNLSVIADAHAHQVPLPIVSGTNASITLMRIVCHGCLFERSMVAWYAGENALENTIHDGDNHGFLSKWHVSIMILNSMAIAMVIDCSAAIFELSSMAQQKVTFCGNHCRCCPYSLEKPDCYR